MRSASCAKQLKDDNAVFEVSPEEFLANYLRAASQQPEAKQNWESDQQVLVEIIRDVKAGKEVELYTGSEPLIRLCNMVSKRVFNSLESQEVVMFHPHHHKVLHDPLQSALMPDIVASYKDADELEDMQDWPSVDSDSGIFSWFNVIAVGEAKIRDPQQERYQTGNYLRKHLQFRPELHSVLGFSADTKGSLHSIDEHSPVQRHLYRKGILHRNISHSNIMMAPKDDGRYYKDCIKGFNKIKYLNQVLNPEESPKPACVVIDLGHGADRDRLAIEPHILAERTGTPRFMSRSVSRGQLLDSLFKPLSTKMPKLTGLSHMLYTSCAAEYDSCNEAVDNFAQPLSKPARTEFRHELFHDAESTFWVICWFLARSAPKDYKPENAKKSNPDLKVFVKAMETHIPGDRMDGRSTLSSELDVWEQVLHPELVDVAPMLHEMHEYIRLEWGYRSDLKEKYAEHAHEALMRLLLQQIVLIEDGKTKDVEFALGETRNLPMPELLPPKSRSTTISTLLMTTLAVDTKKRVLEDDGEDLTQPRRSKRLALTVESAGGGEPSIFGPLVPKARNYEWPQMDKWLELPTHLPSLSTSPSAP